MSEARAAPSVPERACPYPGLRPFGTDEAELFFGRARQVGDMLARLEHRRFLAVGGVSGCGKSSLVRAGLIPAVRDGWLAAPVDHWRIALMRPGTDPYSALTAALLDPEALGPERAGPPSAAAFLRSTLRRGRLGLVDACRESHLPAGTGLLLVVDQFEEIFRFRNEQLGRDGPRPRDDADAFVDLLLASAAAAGAAPAGDEPAEPGAGAPPAIQVVITMRSDFLGDCAVFAGLPGAINDAHFLTPRLTREQYAQAIVEPARLRGGDLAPALVSRLLNDMGEDPDRLPVLQHALMRMWTRAAARPGWDGRLGLADYPAGGLDKALSDHCDEVYEHALAGDAERRLAETLFRALCERSGSSRDTRRPRRIADIAAVAGVAPQALYPVIDAFRRPGRSFLAPPPPEPLTPDLIIDIGHERLIAHWRRLGDWVAAEAASADEYRRLADSARLHRAGRGGLLGVESLARTLEWKTRERPTAAWARRYGGRCREAMAYLEQSRRRAEELREQRRREEAEREAARERELAAARALAEQKERSARNLKFWLGFSALLLLLALAAAGWALVKEREATQQRQLAQEREQAAAAQRKSALESRAKWFMEVAEHEQDDRPQRSLLLALEAYRAAPQPTATETAIRSVLSGFLGPAFTGHEAEVAAVAFDPAGRWLASGSWDGTVRLWDLAKSAGGTAGAPAAPRVLRGHEDKVLAVAFDPAGRWLASGPADGTVRLWDLDLDRVRAKACGVLGRNLTLSEWREYFGDEAPARTCRNRPLHPSFLDAGDELARDGDWQAAADAYRALMVQFGDQCFAPELRAKALAAPARRDMALAMAEEGRIDEALAAYAEADTFDPTLPDNVDIENRLCWAGSLWNRGGDVLPHCERAVSLATSEYQAATRDTRGVARAQTGDLAGAIEDFRAFIAGAEAGDDGGQRGLILDPVFEPRRARRTRRGSAGYASSRLHPPGARETCEAYLQVPILLRVLLRELRVLRG